jgi:Uncharacterized protein conserved in bacteria
MKRTQQDTSILHLKQIPEPLSTLSHKHTMRVRKLRRILPFFALLSVAVVLLWSNIAHLFEKKIDGLPEAVNQLTLHNEVANLRMVSTDDKGNPFKIQAQSATQSGTAQANFSHPVGEFLLASGQTVSLTADQGMMNQGDHQVTYSGHVVLKTDDGYQMETECAVMNLKEQKAEGQVPIQGFGPQGKIYAQAGFCLEKKSSLLTFKGPTRLIIDQSDKAKGKQ